MLPISQLLLSTYLHYRVSPSLSLYSIFKQRGIEDIFLRSVQSLNPRIFWPTLSTPYLLACYWYALEPLCRLGNQSSKAFHLSEALSFTLSPQSCLPLWLPPSNRLALDTRNCLNSLQDISAYPVNLLFRVALLIARPCRLERLSQPTVEGCVDVVVSVITVMAYSNN